MNRELVNRATQIADAEMPALRSLLIIEGREVICERYYRGAGPSTLFELKSITKSVVSALVGIALDRGILRDVDQTIRDVLPQSFDRRSRSAGRDDAGRMTLRHLLTMTSGQEWDEDTMGRSYLACVDCAQFAIDLPVTAPPGQRFVYSSPATDLLSAAIASRAGVTTLRFADEHLFRPLGITAREWSTDGQGVHRGGTGLYLTARGVAEFGRLYLEEGMAGEKRLLDEAWVRACTSKQVDAQMPIISRLDGYGYLWWRRRVGDVGITCALGAGGQFLFVIPAYQTIVAATSSLGPDNPGTAEQFSAMFRLLDDYLIPSASGEGA